MNITSLTRAWLVAIALLVGLSGCSDNNQKKLKIVAEPADVTVIVGATATFTVQANSSKATYQWRRNGANVASATNASYSTAATVAGDSGAKFSVVVTRGQKTVTSREATLTVNAPPAITTQPADASVRVGATASFSVVATGTAPLTYQWRRNGTAINGATAASYTTPALVSGDDGATYSVVITNPAGSVTSSSATVALQEPDVVAWDPSLVVAEGDFDIPVAGMDDQGRGYAVWLDTNSRLLAKSGAIAGAWGTGQFVDAGPDMVGNQGAFEPQLAVNAAGKGVLAWGFFTSGFTAHVAVALGDAGTWGAPKKIGSSFNGDAPSAAVDDSGRAVVVWQSSVANQKIMAAVANGTTWTTPVALGRDPNLGGQPRVAVAADGKGQIVYNDGTAFIAIPVDLSLPQPFGTPVEVFRSTDLVDHRLAVDQQGGAVLVFYDYVNNDWAVRAINLRPGSGWSAPVLLGIDVPFFLRETAVASDEQGNAIAAWGVQVQTVPGGEFKNTVYTSRYSVAGGWSPGELRPGVDADGVEGVQLAASRTGRIVLSWVQEHPTLFFSQVWAQVFDGGRWQAAAPIQASTNYAWIGSGSPYLTRSLAVAPNGDGLLLWVEDDDLNPARNPVMGAFLPQ